MPQNPEASDPAVNADLSDDQAIYEEWAAIAGEPAAEADGPSHGRSGHAPASFDTIAATLTKMQVAAAAHPGSILVLAGAGTGKTASLTAASRIASPSPHPAAPGPRRHLHQQGRHEMATRIRTALGVEAALCWLGTFHGLAARQLRASPEVAHLRENFDILDADDARRILRRVMKALNLSTDEDESGKRDPVKIVANHIAKFKDRLMTPKSAATHVENRIAEANRAKVPIDAAGLKAAARAYGEYQARLKEANAADFGDLLLWPTLALHHDADYRARWTGKLDWVHADEYQDVNFAQYTWLKMLASRGKRLFVVGDDDQSIYGWRGADVAFIRQFKRDFPDAVDIRLEEQLPLDRPYPRRRQRDYRRRQVAPRQDAIHAERAGRARRAHELPRRRIGSRRPRRGAHRAQARRRALARMAVLYRNNFLSRAFEEALMRARIPTASSATSDSTPAPRSRTRWRSSVSQPRPTTASRMKRSGRPINEPRRGFGAKAIEVLEHDASFFGVSLLKAVETAALPPKAKEAGLILVQHIRAIGANSNLTLADQLSLLIDRTGYRAMLRESRAENADQKLGNLAELVDIAGGFPNARQLLDHAALATGREGDGRGDRVSLMTLHKAKGLEFPHVFLPAFETGIIPSPYGDLDEERRLAYVALTRAMRQVRISWALFRRRPTEPSPFLDAIPNNSRLFLSRLDPKHLSPVAKAGLRRVAGRLLRR